jgi:hypothetical protein
MQPPTARVGVGQLAQITAAVAKVKLGDVAWEGCHSVGGLGASASRIST